jgi:hypothetical protein
MTTVYVPGSRWHMSMRCAHLCDLTNFPVMSMILTDAVVKGKGDLVGGGVVNWQSLQKNGRLT